MARTTSLRQQHDDIAQIVMQMKSIVDGGRAEAEAATVRSALNTLGGKLSVHLSMEDKVLYPVMLSSTVANAATMAKQFQTEMGGLAGAFKGFSDKWTETAIKQNAAGFTAEAKQVISLLVDRVQRENTQLYPLADQIP